MKGIRREDKISNKELFKRIRKDKLLQIIESRRETGLDIIVCIKIRWAFQITLWVTCYVQYLSLIHI